MKLYFLKNFSNYNTFKACLIKSSTDALGLLPIIFSKTFSAYMRIFDNEKFNQNIRDISMDYIHKCLVKFTDKRGKEYQEVKRFVASYFPAWHFMKDKDVVEMFKTRRKRKTARRTL